MLFTKVTVNLPNFYSNKVTFIEMRMALVEICTSQNHEYVVIFSPC